MFENKLFIRNVVLGENVVRIGNAAFKNCQWLSKITFNDKIESIGASAFEECEALKEITIPEKVKEIKERTFFKNLKIQNLFKSNKIPVYMKQELHIISKHYINDERINNIIEVNKKNITKNKNFNEKKKNIKEINQKMRIKK